MASSAYNKAYYAANRERLLSAQKERDASSDRNARRREQHAADPERQRAKDREKYARSPKGKLSASLAFQRDHPEYARARNHRRRARQAGAEGSFTSAEWQELLDRNGPACPCCRRVRKLTPDHIVPLAKGGSNYISNIQPLCLSCNASKGDRHQTNYMCESC